MMGEKMCSLGPRRDDRIVAYIYDQCEPSERLAFESHVGICVMCQTELAELDAVRAHLSRWSPPEPRVLSFVTSPVEAMPPPTEPGAPAAPGGFWAHVAGMPTWAQAVAAVLVLGVAAGAANLQVRVDEAGLSVNTGWLSSGAPADAVAVPGPASAPVVAGASAQQAEAPWRSDLASLEQQLRTEFRAVADRPVPASATRVGLDAQGTDEMVRRFRALLDESERKQQRELALRVAEIARESQAQRQADLLRIDRSLGFIQANTGAEMMRNRQRLNSLAVQVNQTRD